MLHGTKHLRTVILVLIAILLAIGGAVSCGKSSQKQTDTTPPVISAIAASGITATTATITWTTNEPATSQVEYGLTTGYGKGVALVGNAVKSHSVSLPGLTPNTTYHFRVKSKDAAQNEAVSGDFNFTTSAVADTAPPVISLVSASGITTFTAIITWTTDEPATSQVEYGLTTSYGSATTLDTHLATSHFMTLTGLTSGTTYHYRVKSKDASENEAISGDETFATSATAADIGHSRSNPAPIGSPVSIQFEYIVDTYTAEVTVLQLIRGQAAWDAIYDSNRYNDPAPSGYEYVLVKIRFHYISGPTPDTKYDYYYDFTVVSSQGIELDRPIVVEPEPTLKAVYPGATTEGWEAFLVQTDDPAPVLTFGRNYDGTGGDMVQVIQLGCLIDTCCPPILST
jgi:hypothetical protein